MLNKGKIIVAERVNVTGQLVTNAGLTVTAEMMPSFRFVAFYSIPWKRQEEVVSDSIWVDVVDSCVGGVSREHTHSVVYFGFKDNFRILQRRRMSERQLETERFEIGPVFTTIN